MPESSVGPTTPRVRVVVPCLNEATTVETVVRDFLSQSGVVEVLVVDNASSDGTAEIARRAGARTITESRPGKGFALVSGLRHAGPADYYVMVDGDDTYPAEALGSLLDAARGADMVIGTRLESAGEGAFRAGHGFGNRLFIGLVRFFFRHRTSDLFSGYRVLSRRFVETVPLIAHGFEIELELSLQALSHHFRIAERPVVYRARPRGSASKLRTYADGLRILRALVLFVRDYRPMAFFGLLGAVLMATSLGFGWLVVQQYLETGQVLRLPLAVLSAALFLLSSLSLACGAILASINRRATELATLIRRQGEFVRDR